MANWLTDPAEEQETEEELRLDLETPDAEPRGADWLSPSAEPAAPGGLDLGAPASGGRTADPGVGMWLDPREQFEYTPPGDVQGPPEPWDTNEFWDTVQLIIAKQADISARMATNESISDLMTELMDMREAFGQRYGMRPHEVRDMFFELHQLLNREPDIRETVVQDPAFDEMVRQYQLRESFVEQPYDPMTLHDPERGEALRGEYDEQDALYRALREQIMAQHPELTEEDMDTLLRWAARGYEGMDIIREADAPAGFVSGVMQGMTARFGGMDEPPRSAAQFLGRGTGIQIDSFFGALEPFLAPLNMSLATLDNFRLLLPEYLEQHEEWSEGQPWFIRNNNAIQFMPFAGALSEALRYTFYHPSFFELMGWEDRFGGEGGRSRAGSAVNLQTGREVDWADYMPSARLGNFYNVGTSPTMTTTGREFLDNAGLFERFNIDDPAAQELVGAAAEFLFDPLLATDIMFFGSRMLYLAGARKAAKQTYELAETLRRAPTARGLVDARWVARNDPMHSQYLEDVITTPAQRSVVDRFGVRPVLHRALEAGARQIDNIMNAPVSIGSSTVRRLAGMTDADATTIPLRYFLAQQGVVKFLGDRFNLPSELVGGPWTGPGVRERGMAMASSFVRAAVEVADEVIGRIAAPVAQAGSVLYNSAAVRVPNVGRIVPRENVPYMHAIGELVWDMVDNMGARSIDDVFRAIPGETPFAPPAAAARAPTPDLPVPWHEAHPSALATQAQQANPGVFRAPRTVDTTNWSEFEFIEAVIEVANAFGVDPEAAVQSFQRAVVAAQLGDARMGHTLSGYEDWVRVGNAAAQELGLDAQLLRRNLEAYRAGIDVDAYIRTGQIQRLNVVQDIDQVRFAPQPGVQDPAMTPPDFVLRHGDNMVVLDERYLAASQEALDRLARDSSLRNQLHPEQLRYLETLRAEADALMDLLRANGWTEMVSPQTGQRFFAKNIESAHMGLGQIGDLPPWIDSSMTEYEQWVRLTRHKFIEEGNPFAHLSPEAFLDGIGTGHMRRIFAAHHGPEIMRTRIQQRDYIVLDPSQTLTGVRARISQEFGEDAAERVMRYIDARPEQSAMESEVLLRILGEATGQNLAELTGQQRFDLMGRLFYGTGTPEFAVAAQAFREGSDDFLRATVRRRDTFFEPPESSFEALRTRVTEEFGNDAAEAVVAYINSRPPNGVIETDALFDIIARAYGRANDWTPRERFEIAARVFYGENLQVQEIIATQNFMRQTQAYLGDVIASPPGAGATGLDISRTPLVYRGRQDLPLDERMFLGQIKDPVVSLQTAGGQGGRAIRSQETLNQTYQFLRERNLVWDFADVNQAEVLGQMFDPAEVAKIINRGADIDAPAWMRVWGRDGRAYHVMPNNSGQWGPLAGKVLPSPIGQFVMLTQQLPQDLMPGAARNFMNFFRRLALAPWATVARNIYGTLAIAQESGVNMIDLSLALRDGVRGRQQYLTTGQSELLGPLAQYVNMFSDSTLSRQVINSVNRYLEELASPAVLDRVRGATEAGEAARVFERALRTGRRAIDEATKAADRLARGAPAGVLESGRFPAPIIPGFGALDLFTYTEEVLRTSIAVAAYRRMIDNGIDASTAAARAAHFGNNAVNNYALAPLGVDLLRNTGMFMFPAFNWFQLGRRVTGMLERPQVYARQQRSIQAANNLLMADMEQEDRERLRENAASFLRHRPRLIIPARRLGIDRDTAFIIPLDKIFPTAFASFVDMGVDAAGLQFWNPLLDAASALISGTGESEGQAMFGRGRIFYAHDDGPTRLAKTLGWLFMSYAPGQIRDWNRLYETFIRPNIIETDRLDFAEELAESQARYRNREPAQFFLRLAGFNTYEHDWARDPEQGRSERAFTTSIIFRDLMPLRRDAPKAMREWVARTGYGEGTEQFEAQLQAIERAVMREALRIVPRYDLSERQVRALLPEGWLRLAMMEEGGLP